MIRYFELVSIVFLMCLTNCSGPDSIDITLKVDSTSFQGNEVPVHVDLQLPPDLLEVPADSLTVSIQSKKGKVNDVPGQIINVENGENELWWILPESNTKNPEEWIATVTKGKEPSQPTFKWEDTPDKHLDLLFDGKTVFRYSYELDDHFEKGKTLIEKNKPFYHIYDLQGENKITNGPEEGVVPYNGHHRGIMIGWKEVGFQGEKLSFWGMEDLTVQKHIKFLKNTAGPVLAQTQALIHWNDSTGNIIIEEKRQATIYRQSPPAILLLDFTSSLKAVNGPVTLDRDAEHGGVQYRAHNDVAIGASGSTKPTYYFDQDGIDPHVDYNLPWAGMSYGLNNKTYSVLELNHTGNPIPTIWSAYRDYGRFGAFFRENLEAGETLTVHYRFWIGEEEMPDRTILSSEYKAYNDPVKIQVVKP